MNVQRATLEDCGQATGIVVVIDVIRAFTTAAYAFATGARDIVPVGTAEEALALHCIYPDSLVMGEMNGLKIDGFDLGNSPSALANLNLKGRRLIQRTTAGTQGIIGSQRASLLLACSFVCAGATVRYIQQQADDDVTLVATGVWPGHDGDEDIACADYLEMLLKGKSVTDVSPFLRRVQESKAGRMLADPEQPDFPQADLDYCLEVDRFDFVMPVKRDNGLLIMQPVPIVASADQSESFFGGGKTK